MSVDKELLNRVMQLTTKEAYVPPAPPPMDPMAMGGAPPMDPAMMGGAPPMDPAMMGGAPPMDPAMMGGAPPMDPAMMGGAPPMDPAMMDPAMMGMDPAAMGAPPADPTAGGMPVMLNMADLEAILAQSAGGGAGQPEEESNKRVTNRDIGERLEQLEMVIAEMANFMGVPLPEGGIGAPTEEAMMPPSEGAAPTDPAPFTEPAEAMAGPVAMPEPQGGLLPAAPSDAAMMPPASIKTASDQEGLRELQDKIRMMNNYR